MVVRDYSVEYGIPTSPAAGSRSDAPAKASHCNNCSQKRSQVPYPSQD